MSKLLFVISAIVAVAFGLLLVFVPEMGLNQFAMTARVQEIFMARAIGAALAALGAVLWFVKDADEALQKKFSMAALAGSVVGIIATVIGVVTVMKGLGWLVLVVEIIFALGFAFVAFLQQRMK